MNTPSSTNFTCPWWLLFTFDNPLRKWVHNPIKILGPYIQPGQTVLDVGCGMGYFSLGLAHLVGEQGQVISADLQPEMLAGLEKRAQRAGLEKRIRRHLTAPDRIGVETPLDFALAFWMVHEVSQRQAFLQEIYTLLKPGGKFLIVEPRLHVSGQNFARTLSLAGQIGFKNTSQPRVNVSRAVLLQK
jgi:ubiquinone/menaquinone biosynthesis C-methylase UbiE